MLLTKSSAIQNSTQDILSLENKVILLSYYYTPISTPVNRPVYYDCFQFWRIRMLTNFFSVKASIIGAKSFSNDDEVYSLVFQQAYRRSLRSSQLGLLYQSKTAVSLYFDLITSTV